MGLLGAGEVALLVDVEEAMGAARAGMEVVTARLEEVGDIVAASEGVEAEAMLLIEHHERLTSDQLGADSQKLLLPPSRRKGRTMYHYIKDWHLGWVYGVTSRNVEHVGDGSHAVDSASLGGITVLR